MSLAAATISHCSSPSSCLALFTLTVSVRHGSGRDPDGGAEGHVWIVVFFSPSAQQCTLNANPPLCTSPRNACPKKGPRAVPAPCPCRQLAGHQVAEGFVCCYRGKRGVLLGARAAGRGFFIACPGTVCSGEIFLNCLGGRGTERLNGSPGPRGRLRPSRPPASPASPKSGSEEHLLSFWVPLPQTSISSSFSWDNFVLSSCFFN